MNIIYLLFVSPIETLVDFVFSFVITNIPYIGTIGAIFCVSIVVNFLALPIYNVADRLKEEEQKTVHKLNRWVTHIKNTFKGDERFMMLSEYYRQNNYHPLYALRNSFSVVIQVPFFIAAYRYINHSESIKSASFWIIKDLGTADSLIKIENFSINVLPIIMTLINIISGVIYSKKAFLREKIQIYGLAITFLMLLYNSPSGLVIYWIFNNLFSLVRNIIQRKFNITSSDRLLKALKNVQRNVILPVVLLFFSIFVYGPVEIFFNNIKEFPIKIDKILPMLYLFFLIFSFLLCIILSFISTKKRNFITVIIYAIFYALFFQGQIIPNDFGLLDGTEIKWSNHIGKIIISIATWTFFNASFIFFSLRKGTRAIKIVSFFALTIFIVQISNLLIGNRKYKETLIDQSQTVYLSKKDQWTVSKNKNVIVFLLDHFSSNLFEQLLVEDSNNIRNDFKDFTFYPDCVAPASATVYSVPAMLTGKMNFKALSFSKYIEEELPESPLGKSLNSGIYNSAIFENSEYIDRSGKTSIGNLSNYIDSKTSLEQKISYSRQILQLTFFKYFPTIFKSFFFISTSDFIQTIASSSKSDRYYQNDSLFYTELCDNAVNAIYDNTVFRFFHLTGAHPPFNMNEFCEIVDSSETSEIKQALGALKIVKLYLEELKKVGVYDNTTFFIISDHGSKFTQIEDRANSILLIKNAKENHAFKVSRKFISLFDFSHIISDALKKEKVDIEERYAKKENDLRFFYYMPREETKSEILYEYIVNGSIKNPDNISPSGKKICLKKYASKKYKLGKRLYFTEIGTGNPYCVSGFDRNELSGTWTDAETAELKFDIGRCDSDLILELDYYVWLNTPQHVKIYANDNLIEEYTSTKGRKIIIPSRVLRKTGDLSIRFELPSHNTDFFKDKRKLALFFQNITISKVPIFKERDFKKALPMLPQVYSKSAGDVVEFNGRIAKRISNKPVVWSRMQDVDYAGWICVGLTPDAVRLDKITDYGDSAINRFEKNGLTFYYSIMSSRWTNDEIKNKPLVVSVANKNFELLDQQTFFVKTEKKGNYIFSNSFSESVDFNGRIAVRNSLEPVIWIRRYDTTKKYVGWNCIGLSRESVQLDGIGNYSGSSIKNFKYKEKTFYISEMNSKWTVGLDDEIDMKIISSNVVFSLSKNESVDYMDSFLDRLLDFSKEGKK